MPNPRSTAEYGQDLGRFALQEVTQAAERKRDAEQGYRAAINRARATESVQAIARAAGVTRQAVYKVLNRGEKS